ncbi:flagellar protein FlaG [Shewanella sp. JM162201]|uniref:Flagellar protein FlaG n=1 Tax=Shewanella jiangmenensis TaxID=2837387 RepID=A0ABS5V0A9_9GAMM|nr:flagellar protein FlaG [Shewanella jiangmenensis]MBT1443056.1 flagellar protein FlaG [Shewanella jiangmenensis]
MDIALVGGQSPQQQQQRAELAATSVKPMAPKETELKRQDLTQPVDASEKAEAKDREEERQSKQDELNAVAQEMSNMMSVMRKGLDFRVDDKSGEAVVSVMDVESGDIIRQIPSEEALKLAQKMSEVTGLLMKTEA